MKATKPRFGYYKKPRKVQYFCYLHMEQATQIENLAREMQVGQGALVSFFMEEVLQNPDFVRLLVSRIKERPEIDEIRRLAAEYAHDAKVQKRTLGYTVCQYCDVRIYAKMRAVHELNCTKRVKLPAIPLIQMERNRR